MSASTLCHSALQFPQAAVPGARSPAAAAATTGAARYRGGARRDAPRWASFTVIALAHVAVFAGLTQIDSVREQISEAAPIFVSFITPAAPVEVARAAPPPQAHPAVQKPRTLVASTRPSPAPMETPIVEAPVVAIPAPPSPVALPPSEPVEVARATPPAPAPITPPRFTGAGLDNAAAEYPLMSRRLKETGRVALRVLVSPAGSADRVELEKSSGFERLDDSALAAVRRWHFVPARQGDQAVAQWVNVSIPFELTRS